MSENTATADSRRLRAWLLGLPLAAAAWWLTYTHLTALADATVAVLDLSRDTRLGEAVHFVNRTRPWFEAGAVNGRPAA